MLQYNLIILISLAILLANCRKFKPEDGDLYLDNIKNSYLVSSGSTVEDYILDTLESIAAYYTNSNIEIDIVNHDDVEYYHLSSIDSVIIKISTNARLCDVAKTVAILGFKKATRISKNDVKWVIERRENGYGIIKVTYKDAIMRFKVNNENNRLSSIDMNSFEFIKTPEVGERILNIYKEISNSIC